MSSSSMTRSRRPRSGSERAACLRAVEPLFAAPSEVDPAVAAVLFGPFRSVRARFLALSTANDEASVAASVTARAASKANDAFNAAFRWWSSSVRSPRGGSRMAELKPLMGGKAVDAFLGVACPEKVHRMDRLLVHVQERPGLGGAPALLAALITATDELRRALGAVEVARRARVAAVRALEAYEPVFDRTYGLVVRTSSVVDPAGLVGDWPVFLRRKARRSSGTAAAVAPTEAPSDAPSEARSDAPAGTASPVGSGVGSGQASSPEVGQRTVPGPEREREPERGRGRGREREREREPERERGVREPERASARVKD